MRIGCLCKNLLENMKKITIITVVFNDVSHIENTILSVINQDYPDLEYIVIDGASTDGTLAVINKYRKDINFIISEKDKGVYDAMNKGIALASGKWINFMNSGDSFFSADAISKAFSSYNDNGEGLIYGDFFMFNQRGKEDHHVTALAETTDKIVVDPSFHQAIFARTSEMKAHPFDISYKLIADYAFLYDLYQRNPKRYYTHTTICNYDGSGLSASTRTGLVKENVRFFLSRKEYRKALFNLIVLIKRLITG